MAAAPMRKRGMGNGGRREEKKREDRSSTRSVNQPINGRLRLQVGYLYFGD